MLTSLDERDLAATGVQGSPAEHVKRLAALAQNAGLDGIVCSGAEVGLARDAWPKGFFVVPGVRPAGSDVADQKRVVTPRAAIDAGASILVIGRPITGRRRSGGRHSKHRRHALRWTSHAASA